MLNILDKVPPSSSEPHKTTWNDTHLTHHNLQCKVHSRAVYEEFPSFISITLPGCRGTSQPCATCIGELYVIIRHRRGYDTWQTQNCRFRHCWHQRKEERQMLKCQATLSVGWPSWPPQSVESLFRLTPNVCLHQRCSRELYSGEKKQCFKPGRSFFLQLPF